MTSVFEISTNSAQGGYEGSRFAKATHYAIRTSDTLAKTVTVVFSLPTPLRVQREVPFYSVLFTEFAVLYYC